MKKGILLILLVVFYLNSFALDVVIKGKASGFAGKEITIYTFKEYITNTKTKVGFTNIDANNNFSFEFNIDNIQEIALVIEDKTAKMIAAPGNVYNIKLNYDPELNKGRIYDKVLSLNFSFPAPTEINQQIISFNKEYDTFFEENYELFVRRDRVVEPKIKAFKQQILKPNKNYTPFVKNYITYAIGTLENSMDVSYKKSTVGKNSENTKAKIYLNYLHNKPILYHNKEYFNLFTNFFEGELKELTLEVKGLPIIRVINDKPSYITLSKELSKYPFLEKKEFRDLFMIFGLNELTSDKYFNQNNILTILEELATTTNNSNTKLIAENVISNITKKPLAKGSIAPAFTLKDSKNNDVSLSNFKGKHIYINFWTSWSLPSLKEMKIMAMLHKKYGEKVKFISICADNDISQLKQVLNKNSNYSWTFLHVGNSKIIEKYQVKTFPTYVLLDKELKVVQFPAARPGGKAERNTEFDLEKYFYNLK